MFKGVSTQMQKEAASKVFKGFLFTLAVIFLYRIGIHIPLPGVDLSVFRDIVNSSSDVFGSVVNHISMFSGGTERISIFSLGVIPYVTSSIVVQLALFTIPYFIELRKEGSEDSRKKINLYTYFLTLFFAAFEGLLIAFGLESIGSVSYQGHIWIFRFICVVTFLGSTFFLIWMGESVTKRGLCNGISLLIFVSILSGSISSLQSASSAVRYGASSLVEFFIGILIFFLLILFIVFIEKSSYVLKLHINRSRFQAGPGVFQQSPSIPFKINSIGVMGPIFASALLIIPSVLSAYTQDVGILQNIFYFFSPGSFLYYLSYFGAIVFFYMIYTPLVMSAKDISLLLSRGCSFIAGVRPGNKTEEYLQRLIMKLAFIGAVYISCVVIIPEVFLRSLGITSFFSGVSLLISVSVLLDMIERVQKIITSVLYSSFIKRSSLRKMRKR